LDVANGEFIPGSDQCRKGSHNGFKYFFNGTSVETHGAFPDEHLEYLAVHQVVSVYYHRSRIYHVNHNAAEYPVGDAPENGLNQGGVPGGGEQFMDWEEIGFHHEEDGSSRIDTNARPYLLLTRQDCDWVRHLLPHLYHPERVDLRNVPNVGPPVGGLRGKLALLIALIALSASPEDPNAVHATLINSMIGSNWGLPQQHRNDHPGCKFTRQVPPLPPVC
jgi:hypothetical protein